MQLVPRVPSDFKVILYFIGGETVNRPGNTVTLSVLKERAHTGISCRPKKFEDQQAVETILKHKEVVPRAAQETVVLLPIDDSSETTSTTAVGETLMTSFLRREEALRKRWTRPLNWEGSSASRGTQSKISREPLASKPQHHSNLETTMPSTQFVEPSWNLT